MGIETYNELMNWSYDDGYSSPNGVLRPRSNYQTHNQSPYAEVTYSDIEYQSFLLH